MTGVCNDGWTDGDEYAVNAGLSNRLLRALPEIYTESGIMAEQWQGISNAGPAAGLAPVSFAGELTQHTTCQIPGVGPCTGIDNTPAQGWDQLYQQLNSSPATAQQSLPWSSDITYSTYSPVPPSGSPASRLATSGDGAGSSAPLCTSGQLAVRFDGHADYGGRPVTYYPFVVTNTSGSTRKVAGPQTVAAITHAGTELDLRAGPDSTGQQETVLPPETSTGFALGLSDTGTQCQYPRQFTVRLFDLAAPVTAPITDMTGGAAVCGDRASVLTALGGH